MIRRLVSQFPASRNFYFPPCPANCVRFADNSFILETANITNGSLGFKVNQNSTLPVSLNVLIQINDAGLRSRVVPQVGFSCSF